MKTKRILIVLASLFVILGCNLGYTPKGDQLPPELQISNFPANYAGTVEINTGNKCDSRANAEFTAFDDQTCVLMVSYPIAYENYDGLLPGDPGYGACINSGDTQAWYINGTFEKGYQRCFFDEVCNYSEDYAAGGSLDFLPATTAAQGVIECSTRVDFKLQITITINPQLSRVNP
jgi:hypothetical protein